MSRSDARLSLQTHDYDGSLHGTYRDAVSRDPTHPTAIPVMSDALARFMRLASSIPTTTVTHDAIRMARRIARGRGNFDVENNLRADDLFCRVLAHDADIDATVLMDVVAEIQTGGSCPQGRTTRLLQLYLTLLPSTPTP